MKNFKSLIFLLAVASCSSDAVQKDMLNYINTELPKVSTLETDALAAYESVTGANYTNDSTVYSAMKKTVIPKYEEFSSTLASIHPATEELIAMHGEYVKAAGDQMEAFKLICLAIEKQDAGIIKQANDDLSQARNLIALWKKDLYEKCKAHGVTLETDDKK
jgi:hypothetical protein